MKMYAYYLPQFHEIKENNEWWGKGFTEWTNVKNAKPLFRGHIQPKQPLNDNYYDLSNINTLKWQSELLNKYKVDGLIFYHYYFVGKKLLEKPAEMLLKNKDLNINFFFCWANHSWKRSWDGTSEMLLEQTYGTKKDWEKHFKYLLPFFKDQRYQKDNNKPMLMVFKTDFKEKNEMFKYFNKKCIENGFSGICIIETLETHNLKTINSFKKSDYTSYLHLREPGSSFTDFNTSFFEYPARAVNKIKKILSKGKKKFVVKYNGEIFYKIMIKKIIKSNDIIHGLFFEWDNTPI